MQAHAESFAPLVLSAAALDCDFVNEYMSVYIISKVFPLLEARFDLILGSSLSMKIMGLLKIWGSNPSS